MEYWKTNYLTSRVNETDAPEQLYYLNNFCKGNVDTKTAVMPACLLCMNNKYYVNYVVNA